MKNKGKEGGEIMVSKMNSLKNEIKAELEKRSKKESKSKTFFHKKVTFSRFHFSKLFRHENTQKLTIRYLI